MTKFKFDAKAGKMIPVEEVKEVPEMEVNADVQNLDMSGGVNIVSKGNSPNVDMNEEDVVFKKFSDLSVMRVDDQATGEWLCYFAGYALDISFNIDELRKGNATKKMEACLEGITRLFRKIILDQAIGGSQS